MSEFSLSSELADFYAVLEQGGDVSPARVLRLEARFELLMEQKTNSWEALQQHVEQVYQATYAKPVSLYHWQWCKDDQKFRLPYQMHIAPVTKA